MPDVARQLKKVREQIVQFQQDIHTKTLEREKLQQEIQAMETQIQQIHKMELDLRLKRSLLGRLDLEIVRLNGLKKRLEREIPNIEREFEKFEMERKFGRSF